MRSPLRKLAHISAVPGRTEMLREALLVLEQETRREPGCRDFRFFQALSDPGTFILIEHFDHQEAFNLHMRMPHTQAFFSQGLTAAVEVEELAPYRS